MVIAYTISIFSYISILVYQNPTFMKKLPLYLLLGCVVCLQSSCKKWRDLLDPDPVLSPCQIKQIQFVADSTDSYSSNFNRIIYFNEKGEPVKSIPKSPSTANFQQYFLYNDKGWLTTLNAVGTYHFYGHDAEGNIVTDTIYYNSGPSDSLGTPRLYYRGITHYYYDAFNRMRRKIDSTIYSGIWETKYEYGADGNLKGYTYDNKLSYRRLSKVIMFLTEDYSINNRTSTTKDNLRPNTYEYNRFHLPSKIIGVLPVPENDFQRDLSGTSVVEYTCTK